MNEIMKSLEVLNTNYPHWDNTVFNYYEDNDQLDHNSPELKNTLESFYHLIKAIISNAKKSNLTEDQIFAPFQTFKCKKIIHVFVYRKLRLYWATIPLAELEKKNVYAAESLVDIIWDQYVVRFSSHKLETFEYPISEEEFKTLCQEIDRFADECIQSELSAPAIYTKLTTETNLSPSLSQYLTNKIDRDWTELELNFIITQLQTLQNTLKKINLKSANEKEQED